MLLLSKSKTSHQSLIPLPIFPVQIGHQPLPPPDQLVQAPLGVVIMTVLLQVLRQLPDASG
jgi:hypothetical protein